MMEKNVANTLYHATIDTVLAASYAQVGKMIFKTAAPKLSFTMSDLGMAVAYMSLAMYTKDMLVKQNIIPADIMPT